MKESANDVFNGFTPPSMSNTEEPQFNPVPIQDVTLAQNCVVDIPTTYLSAHVTLNVLAINNLKLSFIQGSDSQVVDLEKDTLTKFEIIMNGTDSTICRINGGGYP